MEENVPQVNISLEQILAAILDATGAVQLSQDALVRDYSQYAIAVNPVDDNNLEISLVGLDQIEGEDDE